MRRSPKLFIAVVLAFLPAMLFASAPPGVLRWDDEQPREPNKATPGPSPTAYNLSVPITGAGAIQVDDQGRCYVLDSFRQQIVRFSQSGEMDKIWLEDTGHSRRTQVYDMALLSGERIYLASPNWLPEILRFGPDPRKVDKFPGLEYAACIAANEDGRYYLYEDNDMYRKDPSAAVLHRIHAYSADGKEIGSWDTPKLDSITLGPDGYVYASVRDARKAVVYSGKGQLLREIDLSAGFSNSRAWISIAVDRNGDLYCTDRRCIVRYDSQGKPLARWLPYNPGMRFEWASPSIGCLAVRDGLVYASVITGTPKSEVQAFAPDGQCIARYLPVRPETPLPWAVAAQADGSYYASHSPRDESPGAITCFDAACKTTGKPKGLPNSATSIAVRPAGGYYITQSTKLYRTDPQGGAPILIHENKVELGSPRMEFKYFVSLAVDPRTENLLALVSGKSWELWTFGPDDSLISSIPIDLQAEAHHWDEFIAADGKGHIYISETNQHRITKRDMDGKVLATIGKLGDGLGELRRPKGITADEEGRILVADCRNCRVQVFDADGTPLGVWGRMGTGPDELNCPSDVEVCANGDVFVTDTYNDRIVRVPAADFWKRITKDAAPAPVIVREPAPPPVPGAVTVEGVVVAGSDDLDDCIYVEDANRAWGMRVTLSEGESLGRTIQCRLTGTLELAERAARHLKVQQIGILGLADTMPAPLGMANLYVGDGYRSSEKATDLTNLGLLVKTWGRVVSVDPENSRFVINDGSFTDNALGLIVYAGHMCRAMTDWPQKGQYVIVTGMSAAQPLADGNTRPCVRLRSPGDLQIMAEQ